MVINSIQNNKIKEIVKLRDKKYRDRENLFIIEGEHLVEEAKKNNLLDEVFVVEGYDYDGVYVSYDVMKRLSSLKTPPNVLGVCRKLKEKEITGKVLILDGVQDPGNLGTIIRSAVAFDIDTIILSEDTVDLYNEKVIRATQGMIFNINIVRGKLIPIIEELKKNNYQIYVTDVNTGHDIRNTKFNDKIALVMGSEGNGVSDEVKNLSDEVIHISMNTEVESLNVAVATSIILYEVGGRNG